MRNKEITTLLLGLLVVLFLFGPSPFPQQRTVQTMAPATIQPRSPVQKFDWDLRADLFRWLDNINANTVHYYGYLPSNIPNVYAASTFGITSIGSTSYPTSTATVGGTGSSAQPGVQTITCVQGGTGCTSTSASRGTLITASSSLTATWHAAPANGDIALAVVGIYSTTPRTASITSANGITWGSAIAPESNGDSYCAIFAGTVGAGATTTFAATLSGNLAGTGRMAIVDLIEFSGLTITTDQTGTGSATSGTTGRTGAVTSQDTNVNDLAFGCIFAWGTAGTIAQSSLSAGTLIDGASLTNTDYGSLGLVYQVLSSVSSPSYTDTLAHATTSSSGSIATFEAIWIAQIHAVSITSPSVPGTVISIGIDLAGTEAANAYLGLYSNGSSAPGSLLATTASTALNTSTGWQDISVTTAYYFAASTTYWIVFTTSAAKTIYYTSGTPGQNWDTTPYAALPSSWSNTSSDSTHTWNLRFTYTQVEGYTEGTVSQFAGATGSPVNSFSFYTATCNTGDKFVLALYSGSATAPSSELWNSATAGTACAANSWNTVTESSGTADNSWAGMLTYGSYYWFMYQWNSVDTGPSYTSGSSNTGIYLAQTFGTLSSTWSGGTLTTWNWSEYATYTDNQVTMTVSYTVTGGGSGYTAPWFNYVSNGVSQHYQLTTTGVGEAVDGGSTWTVSQTSGGSSSTLLGGSGSSEQWITSQSVTGTASAGTTVFGYQNQYTLTFTMNGHGSPSPASGSWENSGAIVPVTIGADGTNSSSTRYVVNTITGSGSGSFSTSTSGTTQFSVTMNAPITETVTWQTQYTLSFVTNSYGAPSPASGTWENSGTIVAVVIGSDSSNSSTTRHVLASVSGSGSGSFSGSTSGQTQFSVTMNAPITETLSWTTQYTITFTMNSHGIPTPASGTWENSGAVVPVTIGADGSNSSSTRYLVNTITGSGSGSFSTPTSGTTQFSVTMNAPITETVTWTTQYYLTMQAGAGGSVSPASAWENSGTNVAITATPSSGYAFASWTCTGTGCYSGTANPSSVITNAAITETGNFNLVTITVNNRTLTTSSGGANMTAPQTVNPTVEYWYGTGVSDSQSSNDIQSITLDLYRTGHTPGTFAQSFVYSFRWVADGWSGAPSCSTSPGCWQELQSTGWVAAGFNYLVTPDSSVTTISGSALTADWQFAVKLDQLAAYTTNGAGLWNFKVTVASKSNGNPSGTRAGTFDVNLLISVTVPGNMNWGTVSAGSLNVTASGMPVYTTYTANAIVTITISGGGDPTNQYGDSFSLSSIYVGKTSSPANNDGVVLSTSPTVIYSNLPVAANSNLAMYWFISTPNPFTPGTYTFAYYETIQLQSMQT